MPSLIEQEKTIEQKRGELHAFFEEHKKGGEFDLSTDQLGEARTRNDELNTLCQAYEQQKSADEIRKRNEAEFSELKRRAAPPMPSGDRGALDPMGATSRMVQDAYKTFGEMMVESKAMTDYRGGEGPVSSLEAFSLKAYCDARNEFFRFRPSAVKATMLTTAGWAPETIRGPRVVLTAQEMPVVTDLIPQTTTKAAAVKYMEETLYTNNAAAVAEGAVKPESALQVTERTALVQKIATHIPVSKEQLEDVQRVRGYIDNRLTSMVEQSLEAEVISGSGAPPHLNGILSPLRTSLLSQPKGTDPVPDAIFKAMTQIRVTGKARPSGIVMHPTDWQNVRLLRTVDGIYIWGNPSEVGAERIWGLPVVQTTAFPSGAAGTAIVADWANYSELVTREGIDIQVGYINDDFTRNLQRILAEIRAAFLIYRETAFCKVTGL